MELLFGPEHSDENRYFVQEEMCKALAHQMFYVQDGYSNELPVPHYHVMRAYKHLVALNRLKIVMFDHDIGKDAGAPLNNDLYCLKGEVVYELLVLRKNVDELIDKLRGD
ncbi:MAG: hypothetical protein A2W25_11855 [candidate division Zixibacteria bacterium RBG_16_53_22]|nr:MAG: hypothetical protein A2W25_11855 [candidate division Zixibacteria bacterium RBG_16_53_22]